MTAAPGGPREADRAPQPDALPAIAVAALRMAVPGDCRLLFEWANDPDVRASSFSPSPIPWKDHETWFKAGIAAPGRTIYIALDRLGRPLGQIRFDMEDGAAFVDVSVARDHRGRGLGRSLISLGADRFLRDNPSVNEIRALVKADNAASARAFEAAGFVRMGVRRKRERDCLEFSRRRLGEAQ